MNALLFPGRSGCANLALVGAVDKIVSVAVLELGPVRLTALVEPKLNVGGFCAPVGLEVIVAANTTLPVKFPLGVMVIVEVFPVMAPALSDTEVPVTVNPVAVSETVAESLG